ncbi:MAG: hypothetical protein V1698_00115, partial [bacterium]
TEKHIKIANPLSKEQEFLRSNLAISLIKNAKENLRYFDKFKIFEIGCVFIKNMEGQDCADSQCAKKLPKQEKIIGGVIVDDKNSIPYFKAKEVVENLCENLGVEIVCIESEKADWQHLYRSAEIKNFDGEVKIGCIAELNPKTVKKIGIKNAKIAVFELSLDAVLKLAREKEYREIPKFPAVLRDIAVVVESRILAYNIIEVIKKTGGAILKKIELFDVYEGDKIGAGKKNLAFHLVFQSSEKTLSDEEVDEVLQKIIAALEKRFEAELRK